ncbi:ABC transporter substrate-binding protein [Mesorhizobium sp. L48C026A00]|uniref:ABC transporter substrate-binding protein n=1 Tax=Mesorhizobium sp. L48C026A00 TaxID=1287182 RepID=UPI0003CFC020|nr:ABC transporter substrate-binding protein [Mesorhizobium sp. L48C026A00]ESZ02028.1 hypothetical protein X737_38685 [Mesorhizobium sp. L48C026A00]
MSPGKVANFSLRRRSMLAGFGAAMLLGSTRIAQAAQGTTLRIGLSQVPTSADPHFHNLGANVGPLSQIFETLATEIKGELVPWLATAWRQDGDDLWLFDLRQDVTFHDGAPLTAADVVASIKRVGWVPNSPGSFMPLLSSVETAEAVDDHTVSIKTKSPAPFLLWQLAEIMMRASGAETDTAAFNDGSAAIGTGPYKFKSFKPGTEFVCASNGAWWGGTPDWEEVRWVQLSNDAARTSAILAGGVDVIENVPHVNLKALEGNADISVHTSPAGSTYYLAFDAVREESPFSKGKDGKNPMTDVRVRRAPSMAIDRNMLAQRTLGGLATAQSVHGRVGRRLRGISEGPRLRPGRLQGLARRGWPRRRLQSDHPHAGLGERRRPAFDDIAQYWSRIGVDVSVEALPVSTYLPRATNREFSIISGSCSGCMVRTICAGLR